MTRYIRIVLVLLVLSLPSRAQNDVEAMLSALRPVVAKYQGAINVDSTDLFNSLFHKYRKDPLTLVRMAEIFYDRANPDSATAHRIERRILRLHPDFGYVYTLRGVNDIGLYLDKDAGLANMRRAIDLAPNDPRCYVPYVDYRLDRRRNPTRQDTLELRALVENLSQRVTEPLDKIKVVDMLARLKTGSADGDDMGVAILSDMKYEKMVLTELQNYAYRLVRSGQTDRAQEVLDFALAKYPSDPLLYQTAFALYNSKREYAKAEDYANRYFRSVTPDSVKPNDYRIYANCLKHRGSYSEAVENLWKASAIAPRFYNNYDATLLRRTLADDTEQCYKEWAASLKDDAKAEQIFHQGISDFLSHRDEYHARLTWHDLADYYIARAAAADSNDDKADLYNEALRVYQEFTAACTDEPNICMGYYLQWVQAYSAWRVMPRRYQFITYAKAYLDRILTHATLTADDLKYYYSPILSLANAHEEQTATGYASTFLSRYPSQITDTKLQELMQRIREKTE